MTTQVNSTKLTTALVWYQPKAHPQRLPLLTKRPLLIPITIQLTEPTKAPKSKNICLDENIMMLNVNAEGVDTQPGLRLDYLPPPQWNLLKSHYDDYK